MTTIRKKKKNIHVSDRDLSTALRIRESDIDTSEIAEFTDSDFKSAILRSASDKTSDRLELYIGIDKKWRWRRLAANNRIVGASSQGYSTRKDCLNNAVRMTKPFRTVDFIE